MFKRLDPKKTMTIGMMCMAVAGSSRLFLQRFVHGDLADGVMGFLYGVAIAAMLLGLIMQRRRPSGGCGTA
jgi:hypothetical protein